MGKRRPPRCCVPARKGEREQFVPHATWLVVLEWRVLFAKHPSKRAARFMVAMKAQQRGTQTRIDWLLLHVEQPALCNAKQAWLTKPRKLGFQAVFYIRRCRVWESSSLCVILLSYLLCGVSNVLVPAMALLSVAPSHVLF